MRTVRGALVRMHDCPFRYRPDHSAPYAGLGAAAVRHDTCSTFGIGVATVLTSSELSGGEIAPP